MTADPAKLRRMSEIAHGRSRAAYRAANPPAASWFLNAANVYCHAAAALDSGRVDAAVRLARSGRSSMRTGRQWENDLY